MEHTQIPLAPAIAEYADAQASPGTSRVYRGDLLELSLFLEARNTDLLEAKQVDLTAWIRALRTKETRGRRGLRDSTIARKLRVAKSFYDFQLEKRTLVENPARFLKPPKIDKSQGMTPLNSKREVEVLLGVMDPSTPLGLRDRTITMLFYGQGLRLAEVATLERDHLTTEDGYTVIRRAGKGGRKFRSVLSPEAERLLREHLKKNAPHGRYIFRAMPRNGSYQVKEGRDPRTRPLSAWSIRKSLKRHARLAGLDPGSIRPHAGRVFFVTEGYRRTGDLEAVSRDVGHVSIATTRGYLHHLAEPKDSVTLKIKLVPREPLLSRKDPSGASRRTD